MKLLSSFEERLSNVPRWTIVRTIQNQSVAEHSFRVALIASRLVPHFFSPANVGEATNRVFQYALLHDQAEAFTGDLPTPAGKFIDKKAVEDKFDKYFNERVNPACTVKVVVKVADYVEALIFLAVEMRMGNKSVSKIYRDVETNLDALLYSMYKYEVKTHVDECIKEFLTQEQDPLSDKTT